MTLASNYQCLVGNKCKNVFIDNHLMVIKVDFFIFWLRCKKKKKRKFTGNFQPIHDPFFYGCLRKCKNGNSAHSFSFLSFKMFFADFFFILYFCV